MLSVSTEDAAPFPPDGPNLSGISAAPTAAVERRMRQSCRHQLFPVHFIFSKTMGKAKNDPGMESSRSVRGSHTSWRIYYGASHFGGQGDARARHQYTRTYLRRYEIVYKPGLNSGSSELKNNGRCVVVVSHAPALDNGATTGRLHVPIS